ncbi:MAG: hypothetical protein FJ297_03750 [Planctomycetes bacterium]|nr:hypothetical protein [Planctomycetota bacterium]
MSPHEETAAPHRSRPRFVESIRETVDRSDVLRYLGYPRGAVPHRRIDAIIDLWIDASEGLADPRAVYRVMPILSIDRASLRVGSDGDDVTFRGSIGEYLGLSRRIAVFVATAGPELERKATERLEANDDCGAMVLSAIGAERAEAAVEAVQDALRDSAIADRLAPMPPYSPGYCGMKLTEQRKLFGLVDATAIGVTLNGDCQMHPIKSLSGLIGLGPADRVADLGSACDHCGHTTCSMRR